MREANAKKKYEERTIDVSYDLINTLKIKQTYFHNVDWLRPVKASKCEKNAKLKSPTLPVSNKTLNSSKIKLT